MSKWKKLGQALDVDATMTLYAGLQAYPGWLGRSHPWGYPQGNTYLQGKDICPAPSCARQPGSLNTNAAGMQFAGESPFRPLEHIPPAMQLSTE